VATVSLALEVIRWALVGRFPELRNLDVSGKPGWVDLFAIALMVLFGVTGVAVLGHITVAARTRNWRDLNPIGMILFVASVLVGGLASRY